MNKLTSILAVVMAVAIYSPSVGVPNTRQVWIANSPILEVRSDAGGYSISQRVHDLQMRMNDLLAFGKRLPRLTAMKSGMDTNIYAGKEFVMTVTADDARANKTSSYKMAKTIINKIHWSVPAVISLYQPSGVRISNLRVPANTVIKVSLDDEISSASSKVGDNFYAYQTGASGAFPEGTRFTGRIESVTPASNSGAGQVGISIVGATLPDGTRLPLAANLTALDEQSVRTDPSTGRLVSTGRSTSDRSKFIAYGAGAGLAIGQAMGDQPFLGAVLGAGAGAAYAQQEVEPALGSDVRVTAGTDFGIVLARSVTLPDTTPGAIRDTITEQ